MDMKPGDMVKTPNERRFVYDDERLRSLALVLAVIELLNDPVRVRYDEIEYDIPRMYVSDLLVLFEGTVVWASSRNWELAR